MASFKTHTLDSVSPAQSFATELSLYGTTSRVNVAYVPGDSRKIIDQGGWGAFLQQEEAGAAGAEQMGTSMVSKLAEALQPERLSVKITWLSPTGIECDVTKRYKKPKPRKKRKRSESEDPPLHSGD
jgi:NADPH-dependent 7-cyano-7-deazaguanine reductase QueF